MKNFFTTQLRDFAIFVIASAGQSYLLCPHCNVVSDYSRVFFFSLTIWTLLWKGNEILSRFVSVRISWIEFPTKRFLIGIIVTIAYTVLAVLAAIKVFETWFGFNFGKSFIYTIYSAVAVTVFISFFIHAKHFLMHLRQATLEKTKFEKESITARYEALKNQVNPHFLFNSLNALTNLVYEDQDKAVKFIKQLSEVYRYVLDSREKEVVPITEELEFLKSYLFLQQIRFGDKLKIQISISRGDFFVTPLALQMLVENAIKHNVVSEDDPLSIVISDDDQFISVENNVQKKKTMAEPSSGVGLENIQKRYAMLTNMPVGITDSGSAFKVSLPMLTRLSV
jgi:sensor histidine kinase YesM